MARVYHERKKPVPTKNEVPGRRGVDRAQRIREKIDRLDPFLWAGRNDVGLYLLGRDLADDGLDDANGIAKLVYHQGDAMDAHKAILLVRL